MKAKLGKPLLLIAAVMIALGMLRLGVWQLGRAAEKQQILDQRIATADLEDTSLNSLLNEGNLQTLQRFRPIRASGKYRHERSLLVDNQVVGGKVGYLLFTVFEIEGSEWSVLVNRGWLPVGDDRAVLPQFATRPGSHDLYGRLNLPPASPPLWNAEDAVNQGSVWQYLPIDRVQQQFGIKLLPMVLELAPDFAAEQEPQLQRQWREIGDKWVATHYGYAFQWFAMAFVFLVACAVLALRTSKSRLSDEQ